MTQAESDRIKRLAKRVALLEDAVEILLDQNAGLIAAVQKICKRLGASAATGTHDPMCIALVGPGMRPRVIDMTQIESIPDGLPGFHALVLAQLPETERVEYDRLSRVFKDLRRLREERQLGIGVKAPGGGAPGAHMPGP
jgi:hypothetical protein